MSNLPAHRTRSDWLDLLARCQNGEATCLFVLQEIERLNVPIQHVEELSQKQLDLCHAIERIPAGPEQTSASELASFIRLEMDTIVNWESVKKDLAARRIAPIPQDLSLSDIKPDPRWHAEHL